MKVLMFSDIHLCDTRSSYDFDVIRLKKLADFIRSCGADAVVNIGDTVSRKEFLRPEFADGVAGFKWYLQWRSQFSIPFFECAISRELGFFAGIMGQEPDFCREVSPDLTVITVAPQEANDHCFSLEQLDFLTRALTGCRTEGVLIASHVPYPGSCSREIAPGIFLEIPEELRKLVEESNHRVFWCGGHFHWALEEVRRFGSLTAFHGGRFCFESSPRDGYLRMLDTADWEVKTVLDSFQW